MEKHETAVRVFRELLSNATATDRDSAVEGLRAAAKITVWRRNQSCGSAIDGGLVGCLLTGMVRRYSVRPDGHRQILDILFAGDFLGLVPSSHPFFVEAIANNTEIAFFRPEQIKRLADLHPAISHLLKDRLAEAVRRLEDHLLVQSRIARRIVRSQRSPHPDNHAFAGRTVVDPRRTRWQLTEYCRNLARPAAFAVARS